MNQWKIGLGICICLCMASCSSLELGWRAQKKGDFAEAQNQSIIALSREPKNPDVYRLIASTALSKGEFDRAAKAAEFARSLDGGSAKTERLLRRIYRQKSSHADLCEAGNRLSQKRYGIDDGELESFDKSYKALAPSEKAYGCLRVLQDYGQTPTDGDDTKVAYIHSSIQKGKIQEAIRVVETLDSRSLYMIEKARIAFMTQERDEAKKLLNAYVDGQFGDGSASQSQEDIVTFDKSGNVVKLSPQQMRIDSALSIYEDYNAWGDAADLMGKSDIYIYSIRRVIALKRCLRTSEANEVLDAYMASAKRTSSELAKDIEELLTYGYGDDAWRVYETHIDADFTVDDRLAIASLFEENALSSMSVQIIQQIVEDNSSNADVIKKVFIWYRDRGYDAKALAASDVLVELHQIDDEWMAYRLEAMVNSRATTQFQTESRQWIESRSRDKNEARRVVAKLEKKRKQYKAVVELLDVLEREKALRDDDVDLYIDTLYQLREYDKLDTMLTRYRADIDRQRRAQYFESSEAEVYYKKSLDPLLSGSASEQSSAYLLLARYEISYKNDIDEATKDIRKAIDVSRATSTDSYIYESAITMLFALGHGDVAVTFAKEYVDASSRSLKSLRILAETYLKLGELALASQSFDDYLSHDDDVYKALRDVFERYSFYNFADEGLSWLESHLANYKSNGNLDNYSYCVDTLAEARKQVYIRSFSDESLYRQAQSSYRELFEIDKRVYGVKALYGFSSIRAWNDADDVCRSIIEDNSTKDLVSQSVFGECLRIAMKAQAPVERYRSIIANLRDEKEILSAAEILETHEMFYVLRDKLETLLSSGKSDTARKAYTYLARIDADAGDIESYRRHMAQFEKTSSNSADARLRLAYDAMSIGAYDDAVRLLTALQSTRPDARDVIWAQIELARRAPSVSAAQSLLEATIEGASGVFHRLEWIAQGYAQHGDYRTAIGYAQKAWDTGAIQSPDFRWQMLGWYVASGTWDDNRDAARAHIAALRSTSAWRADRLLAFAQRAFDSGYTDIAQNAIQEAARLAPDDASLKRYRLDRAMESGDRGQIVLALDDAIQSPQADNSAIIDALREKGAYLDVIDVIDDALENGDVETGLSVILAILPQYIDRYGAEQTLQTLRSYADRAKGLDIDAAMAQITLATQSPCNAYSHVYATQSPSIWYDFIAKCPSAYRSAISSINAYRSELSDLKRRQFDASFVDADRVRARFDSATIEELAIDLTPLDRFERAIVTDHPIEAIQSLGQYPPPPQQIPKVAQWLAFYGYKGEISDVLAWNSAPLGVAELSQIACARLLAGDDDPSLVDVALQSPESLASLDKSAIQSIIPRDAMEKALLSAPSNKIQDLLVIAAKSFTNTSSDDSLWRSVRKAINSQSNRSALWVSFAASLLDAESYAAAAKCFRLIESEHTSSDYIERLQSRALAKTGDDAAAWQSIERGERYATSIGDYWARVWSDHRESSVGLRQKINEQWRAIQPRRYAPICDAIAIALEQGDDATAGNWATKAYEIGGVGAIDSIVAAYEAFDKSAQIPDIVVRGASAAAAMAAARKSFALGDRQQAIASWIQAFERSSWPLGDYESVAQQLLFESLDNRTENDNGFEQITAQMAERWPFAVQPAVFRSIGDLMKSKGDEMPSVTLAVGRPEARAKLAAYAVLIGKRDLARQIVDEDRNSASFDADIYASAFVDAFSKEKLDRWCPKTADERLQSGVAFVVENLIDDFKSAKLHSTNVAQLRAWAKSAHSDDAIRAMIWLDQ